MSTPSLARFWCHLPILLRLLGSAIRSERSGATVPDGELLYKHACTLSPCCGTKRASRDAQSVLIMDSHKHATCTSLRSSLHDVEGSRKGNNK